MLVINKVHGSLVLPESNLQVRYTATCREGGNWTARVENPGGGPATILMGSIPGCSGGPTCEATLHEQVQQGLRSRAGR